jgi:signal transduction histidine kinase
LLEELKEEAGKGNLEEVKSLANDVIGNEEKINHHGKRAESIVRGMLLHSRGSSGHKELVDINALCDEYLRLSYHGFRAKDKSFNADFKLEADQSLPKIEVVPQDIGRVLLNLINNAFYAVSERSKKGEPGYAPTVTVTAQLITSSQLQVAVKDNGSGIPDSIKDKIFQPFFTTKPTGQGTGLGLSLSYDIMKAHGGEIKVNTKSVHYDVAVKNEFMHRDQTGTEFTVILPA